MDGAQAVARSGQLGMDGIHLRAALEMKGEMGAGGLVGRTQQGHTIAGFRRLQIGPIVRFPGEPQAQQLIKSHRPGHVLHTQSHMAQPVDRCRCHGGWFDHGLHSRALDRGNQASVVDTTATKQAMPVRACQG